MTHSVLVVGSRGMIGSMVASTLSSAGLEILEISRSSSSAFPTSEQQWSELMKERFGNSKKERGYVVNCVGLTKTYIPSSPNPSEQGQAIFANSLFPAILAGACERNGLRMIQVQTDCVFSGQAGGYTESSLHDAGDLYGRSKSLGEVTSSNVMNLRCSVIGPELNGKTTLFFEWLRSLPLNSEVNGYQNHRWNGLTSLALAKVICGIISSDHFRAGLQHLVPADVLTKSELVNLVLSSLGRSDVTVRTVHDRFSVDRSLATDFPVENTLLFKEAGFPAPPPIKSMVESLVDSLRRGES